MAKETLGVGEGKVRPRRDFGYKDFLARKEPCFSTHRSDHSSAYNPV